MDIREVHLEKKNGMVMTEDCILCTQCMQACPENNVLKLQFINILFRQMIILKI